jgi:hypothetical protein
MPSARQPNPHRRRRDDRLPWFGGLLALFWMLASPWLRADVCEVRVGIDATGRADAVAWTDRIVAGLSAPSFRFVNRTEGAPAQEIGSDYLVLVSHRPDFGSVSARLVEVTTGRILAASEPASDQALLEWIRGAVQTHAQPFELPDRGAGPDVEIVAGGCGCLYYAVDRPKTQLAVRSGYGWLLAAPSPHYPWPWRRYDDAPTFAWSAAADGKPFRPNGEPNAMAYYASPFMAGLRDTVHFLAYCPKDPQEKVRLSPVRVAIVPPKMTLLVGAKKAIYGDGSFISEVGPAGDSRILSSWKQDSNQGEPERHIFRCPPSAKKRVVWASLEVQDSCSGCTLVTMVGKTRSWQAKTNVWEIPSVYGAWENDQWVHIEAISADLYQIESIEITSHEGFYRNITLGWATWDCPDSALRFLPADSVPLQDSARLSSADSANLKVQTPSRRLETATSGPQANPLAGLAPGPGFSHTELSLWDFSKANSASCSASPTSAPSPGPSLRPGTARAQRWRSPTRASDSKTTWRNWPAPSEPTRSSSPAMSAAMTRSARCSLR